MKDSIISSIEKRIDNVEENIKYLVQELNKDKDLITSAQEIVKKFIIDKKLIVYGGLAIDYALRLKGSSIYYEHELPDYDCVSYRNVDDAYDLGEILFNAGFESVKVIRAKHVETMRVRVNLITVADIGFIPKKYFDLYKSLVYKQLHILHPDIQRLDLHRAFCFPLNNAPMEDIFHRWLKDLKRFKLYEQYYPIIPGKFNLISRTKIFDISFLKKYKITEYALHGFAAFALFRNELIKHIDCDVPDLNIKITKNKISLDIPVSDSLLHIVTYKNIDTNKNNKILDVIPVNSIINDVNIYEVSMLSIVQINFINVVNVQYLLMWLLFNYNFNDSIEDRSIYGNFYLYTIQMIELSQKSKLVDRKNNPFNPSITLLGPMSEYELPKQNPRLPINYTPEKIGTRPSFDYSIFSEIY